MLNILWVIWLILRVLLGLLAGFILLGLLLMIPRTGVHLRAANGSLTLMLFYGKLHRVFRIPGEKKKQKEPAPAKPKKEKSAAKKTRSVNFKNLDEAEIITDVLELLADARNTLRIDLLRADVTIATGDAARTGILLGYAFALGGMIFPFLEQTFHIKTFHVVLDGDFQGETTRYDVELSCSLRPIQMLWLGVRRIPKIYRYYRLLTKNVEANEL